MKLYSHQEKFLSLPNNDNEILTFETGTGKGWTAEAWLEQKDRKNNALIVCPKQIRERWKAKCPFATVYSFEDFVKYPEVENPSAVVIDEGDCMASPLFVPKLRSKRTEKMFYFLQKYPSAHVLIMTATPVRSSPWNMHTLLVFTKKMNPENWKMYRMAYFSLEQKPYLPRPAWLPKPSWRKDMQELINRYTHTALMSDVVELPSETHEVETYKAPIYDHNDEWEPMAQFVADHRAEQKNKPQAIVELSRGYRKVVVVVHYTEQIDELVNVLKKDRNVFVLDGRTKNAEQTIEDAEADPECFFIIQASVAAGFELPSFAVMIFASMGFSVRNWSQMIGRIKRINALKPVKYVYMLGGRADKAVYENIQAGRDFIPSQYLQYGITKED